VRKEKELQKEFWKGKEGKERRAKGSSKKNCERGKRVRGSCAREI
jgi:hypothetical protein